jgi:hypothetical protein
LLVAHQLDARQVAVHLRFQCRQLIQQLPHVRLKAKFKRLHIFQLAVQLRFGRSQLGTQLIQLQAQTLHFFGRGFRHHRHISSLPQNRIEKTRMAQIDE